MWHVVRDLPDLNTNQAPIHASLFLPQLPTTTRQKLTTLQAAMELRSRKKLKTTHPVEPLDNQVASKSPSTSHVDGQIIDNANDGAKTAGRQRQRRSKLEALNFPIDIFIEVGALSRS